MEPFQAPILPYGNIKKEAMKYTPEQIGELVRSARKSLGVTQKDLAMTSGTGLRFIIDLEKGKPTCQLGKVLTVLHTLGIKIKFISPEVNPRESVPDPKNKEGV
jgi:y4mF family transcriptional regulator